MSNVGPSGRRGGRSSIWYSTICNAGDYQFCHICHAFRRDELLSFYTSISHFDFCWGHKVSKKQNLWRSYLAFLSSDQDQIGHLVEVIEAELPDTILDSIYGFLDVGLLKVVVRVIT